MKWVKTEVNNDDVKELCAKYGVDALTASIMLRRNIISGQDVWPFIEDATRYLHNPFLFETMEDAVDRILDAVEEGDGTPPKVLVFGDRDVDGITATIIMEGALKQAGCDVTTRVPTASEPYGITVQAVDDFAASGGELIVTVDCGISCAAASKRAAEYGIDLIVTDHHNVTGDLPDAIAILDPKQEACGYPFAGLSGAGVALKVSYALKFARLEYYKSDITILDVHLTSKAEQKDEAGAGAGGAGAEGGNARVTAGDAGAGEGESITVECIKTHNLIAASRFTQTFKARSSIADSRLASFLAGEHIFVWDAKRVTGLLASAFGSGVEFALTDLKGEMSKTWRQFANKSIEDIQAASRVSLYGGGNTRADALYNLFVTYVMSQVSAAYQNEADDLCLAALSTMADIMPMADENRIIVKAAMRSINALKIRRGLAELMARQSLMGSSVTARDLSWTVIPALNAAGRMGKSESALGLLSSEDAQERENLAQDIFEMNEERKQLVNRALSFVGHSAKESLEENGGKMILVANGRITKGITGLVASRFAEQYGVPAIVAAIADDKVTGSMRSARGVSCTEFLSHISSLFIDYGGHNSAAGFSLKKDLLDEFCRKAKEQIASMELPPPPDAINVDAEIPKEYIPLLPKVVDFFSPFGTGNEELLFMTRGLVVCNALVLGKTERQHLKLILDCDKTKCPAMIWGGAELLGNDINAGDTIDVLYTMTRNTFGGISTPQMIIKDWHKSTAASR